MKFFLVSTVAAVVMLALIQTATSAEACPDICTLELKPVCGKVGDKEETFPNRCAFEITECNNRQKNGPKVEFLRDGKC